VQAFGALALADGLGRLIPIHPRHLHVHEDDTEAFPIPSLDGLDAVGGDCYPVAAVFRAGAAPLSG
jgi:hypothetical protein